MRVILKVLLPITLDRGQAMQYVIIKVSAINSVVKIIINSVIIIHNVIKYLYKIFFNYIGL